MQKDFKYEEQSDMAKSLAKFFAAYIRFENTNSEKLANEDNFIYKAAKNSVGMLFGRDATAEQIQNTFNEVEQILEKLSIDFSKMRNQLELDIKNRRELSINSITVRDLSRHLGTSEKLVKNDAVGNGRQIFLKTYDEENYEKKRQWLLKPEYILEYLNNYSERQHTFFDNNLKKLTKRLRGERNDEN